MGCVSSMSVEPPSLSAEQVEKITKQTLEAMEKSKDLGTLYEFVFREKLDKKELEVIHTETMKDNTIREKSGVTGFGVESLFKKLGNEITDIIYPNLKDALIELMNKNEDVAKLPDGPKGSACKKAINIAVGKAVENELKKKGQLILKPEETKTEEKKEEVKTEEKKEEPVKVEEVKPEVVQSQAPAPQTEATVASTTATTTTAPAPETTTAPAPTA
eukprot:TRINITY_DN6396_c0_g1_i1.p1 TRINITY_DN6396_c0_g1~~TRINITY_DN6396_c0_g1_i1.p1  ORF type:complete len:217 (+),score=75.03 TRINITY_DN6396_c0_g1_i1:61-711(+)